MGSVELGGVLVYGAKVMLPRWDLINLWGTYSTPTSDVWDGTIHIKRERRTITVTGGLWSIMGLCVASKYLTGISNAFIFDCPISFLLVFSTSVCLPNKKDWAPTCLPSLPCPLNSQLPLLPMSTVCHLDRLDKHCWVFLLALVLKMFLYNLYPWSLINALQLKQQRTCDYFALSKTQLKPFIIQHNQT